MKNTVFHFDKDASLAIKGIAILLMLFHHNFRSNDLFKNYIISFWPFQQSTVVYAAALSKICVSLFAFVSGYGLYLCYQKRTTAAVKWTASRYVKTFSGYWFIWLPVALITQLINGRFVHTFFKDDVWNSLMHIIIDFLGLANLFRTSSLINTWWYMSACFVFITLTPILLGNSNEKRLPLFLTASVIIPRIFFLDLFSNGNSAYPFIFIFLLGMFCAEYNLIDRIINSRHKWFRFVIEFLLLAALYKAYGHLRNEQFCELKWGLFPLVLILFSAEFVIGIPGIRQVLQFLGRHSMNVYMVHTFIRGVYLIDFTYSWKHFAPVVVVLLIISLSISLLLEWLKALLKYDAWIKRICSRIEQI